MKCFFNNIKEFNVTFDKLKGIIQPKLKILESFTHPQVDPNRYEFHKRT